MYDLFAAQSLGVEAANRELERVQKEKEQIENDFQKRNINARVCIRSIDMSYQSTV